MDDIEKLICDALQQMAIIAQQNRWNNPQWTCGVKQTIVDVGRKLGWLTAANGCNSDEGKEWLYDVVWYQLDQSRHITDVPLVAESEWKQADETKADFEKLLLARAKYRVMVFESANVPAVCTKMRVWIDKFRRTQQGDRYLLAGWCGSNWHFELVVAQ